MAKKRTPSVDPETITKPGTWRVAPQLYVQVRPDQGTRSWLFRYQRNGRARWMGLGPVDLVKPDEAKAKALEYRAMLLRDVDPYEAREAERPATPPKPAVSKAPTFRVVAEQYVKAHEAGWSNPKHRAQWSSTLESYAFPVIGDLPVDRVEVAHVLQILEPIWSVKPETASRLRGRLEAIIDAAEVKGYRQGKNPARLKGNLQHLLPPLKRVRRVKHHEAVPVDDVPALCRELGSRDHTSARALLFTALTAARTIETRLATWDEFDLNAGLWTLPPERMKGRREHRAPLAPAVVEMLKALPRGDGALVFPGAKKGKPMSDMAMLELLRGLRGMGATVHGLRSSFRDWAAERGYPDEVAEAALAHADTNKTRRAYLRSELIEQRRAMMDAWAAHCLSDDLAEA